MKKPQHSVLSLVKEIHVSPVSPFAPQPIFRFPRTRHPSLALTDRENGRRGQVTQGEGGQRSSDVSVKSGRRNDSVDATAPSCRPWSVAQAGGGGAGGGGEATRC